MAELLTSMAKYAFIILIVFYTYFSFAALRGKNQNGHRAALELQGMIMFLIHLIAYALIFINTKDTNVLMLYAAQVGYFIITKSVFRICYGKKFSRPLLNNMCMLLSISFIIIARLSYDKALKQFVIVAAVTFICFFIPLFIKILKNLPYLTWVYCIAGIIMLGVVLVMGRITYGAKISINLGFFAFQPSEFVKILYVLFLAAFLSKSQSFKRIVISAVFAGLHVIILVFSSDLGSALIFFIVYVFMVYVATGQARWLGAGAAGGTLASLIAYKLFSHVRIRVLAYRDPWSVIDNEGYQVAQSLFAIGTGSWLGMGMYKGLPESIPVVTQDFIFSAIAEEFGGFFAISLILICLSTFLTFIKIAMAHQSMFYKLTGLGMGMTYAVQTVLTIGGAIKFIPSTGVTLPLVSYGGSSVLCTLITFAIIQGISVSTTDTLPEKEDDDDEDR
ncbi:FtsW/RodA/SpoVE family cell cycle protein [Lachnospiraceae bacterium HCP1S3_C3]|nr:FtsW/RodA/SpoVE family cell cycle protein [Lachnospiraceae bacterium]MDD6858845.1 FtsW/RodA/SpoVE family cell cycle protein [Lachnospiraceae bacterium]